MAQVSKSSSSPNEIWIMSDGLGNPVNWLQLTSSYAVTAAFALNGGGGPGPGLPSGPTWSMQFNSASVLSGSPNFIYDFGSNLLYFTGTFNVSGAISASLGANTVGFFGTASWAQSASRAISSSFATSASAAISSSYAITASYALNAGAGSSANVNGDDQYLARFSGSTAVETSTLYNDRVKKSLALNYNQSIAFGSESITLGKLLHAQGNYDHIANLLNSTAPVYTFTGYNDNIKDYGFVNTYYGFFGLKSGDFTRKWYGLDTGSGNPTILRLLVYQPSQNAIAIFSGSAADFGYSFYGNIEGSNDLTSFASSSNTSRHVNSAATSKQPENIAWIGCKNAPINIQGTIAKSTTAVDVPTETFGHTEDLYYVYVITNEFDTDNDSVYGNSLEGFGNSVYHLNPSSDLDSYYNTAYYNHVEGYLNQVRGNINHVQNQENIVVGDNNDISGLYNAIYGNKNLVYGEYNGLGSTATSDFNRFLNITSVTRSNVDNQEHTSTNFPGPPNVDVTTYKINLCILNGSNVIDFATSQSLAGYYSEDKPYFAVLYRGLNSTVETPLIIPVWSARPSGFSTYTLFTSADILPDNTTARGVNYHLLVNTDVNSGIRTTFPENNVVLGNQNLLSGTGNTAITTGSKIAAVDSFFVGKNLIGRSSNNTNNTFVFGRDSIIPTELSNSFGIILSSSIPQFYVTRSWVGINTTTIPSSSFFGLRVANDLWVDQDARIVRNLYVTGSSYLGNDITDSTVVTGSLIVSNSFNLIGTGRVTGSFIVSNSLNVIGTSIVTGSNIVSGSWNLIGTGRVTGSLIVSNSLNVIGNSLVTGSNIVSGSWQLTGPGTITGSLIVSNSLDVIGRLTVSGTFIDSGSFNLIGTGGITGSLIVSNSLTTIGSNTTTGSLFLTGSGFVTGTIFVSGAVSASLGPDTVGFFGTASWAQSASQAITSSFSLSGNGIFSGSFSGSLFGILTGSVYGTSSWSDSASWSPPSGPDQAIQFNDAGNLSGSGNFLFIKGTNTVSLTGSLLVTGSSEVSGTFAVNSGFATQTQPAMQINSDGVFVLGEYTSTPTAIAGGMIFSGSEFYLGFS